MSFDGTICDLTARIMNLDTSGQISEDQARELADGLDAADGLQDGRVDLCSAVESDYRHIARDVERFAPAASRESIRNGVVALLERRDIAFPPGSLDASEPSEPPLQQATFALHVVFSMECRALLSAPGVSPEIRAIAERTLQHISVFKGEEGSIGNVHFDNGPLIQAIRANPALKAEVREIAKDFESLAKAVMDVQERISKGAPVTGKEMEPLLKMEQAMASLHRVALQAPTVPIEPVVRTAPALAESASKLQTLGGRLGPYGKPVALLAAGILIGAGLVYAYQQWK